MGKLISEKSARRVKRVCDIVEGTPQELAPPRTLGSVARAPHSFWAVIESRLTPASGCTPWSWTLQTAVTCTFADPLDEGPSDRSGSYPAYEVYGKEASIGEKVRMWKGAGDYFHFETNTHTIKGKLDGVLNQGSSATMSRWVWNGAAEADNTVNVTVYDWLLATGQTVASGAKVVATWIDGRYYVVSAECA